MLPRMCADNRCREVADFAWLDGVAASVVVCDRAGVCTYLNAQAEQTFAKDGGAVLLGKNLLDCHPEPARSRLRAMLDAPQANTYTIEKNGQKKLIQQMPVHTDGQFVGVVEISFEIPFDLPHFIR